VKPKPERTREAADRFLRYCLHVFADDPDAEQLIRDAFRALEAQGCPNPLDGFINMCREIIATYGVPA
jgi:hypothetical protein